MNSKTIAITAGAAVLAAAFMVPVSTPAHATTTTTKPLPAIGSYEQRDVRERERVRRQQVRQNAHRPIYQPLFGPLYQGKNSPGQQVKRAFD
ncbi:hypothetical protein AncyloWKF20_11405 [Ancylobacter sp. WKF20]|uniref:hypothetical protein n=1 Tax=Ancylobacter sp. WKF20 TaxID=3039801 RepID=UPI0024343D8B|nr:hypothetical protein [Ancylobacter sp. WKF20]WGD28426.1 hypothetical protein AncyloWKF20_11405 [Ancylobacter sp. WKF20]